MEAGELSSANQNAVADRMNHHRFNAHMKHHRQARRETMTTLSMISATRHVPLEGEVKARGFYRQSARAIRLTFFAYLALLCTATVSAQTYKDIFDFDGTTHGCCPQYPNAMAQ